MFPEYSIVAIAQFHARGRWCEATSESYKLRLEVPPGALTP